MNDDLEQQETGGVDLVRRRAMWRALAGAPVILTLSSTPAWASHTRYHYPPPPGCDPPPKPDDPDCNPND